MLKLIKNLLLRRSLTPWINQNHGFAVEKVKTLYKVENDSNLNCTAVKQICGLVFNTGKSSTVFLCSIIITIII